MISGKARVSGVIGWPVSHSVSPMLHNHWMSKRQVDGVYIPLPVRPDDLPAAVAGLKRSGFLGFNVTIPHKTAMLALVDEVDNHASRIGSVNTVIVRPDGSTIGRSTDGIGFMRSLSTQATGWSAEGKCALILGAGGAARAVGFALADAGTAELRLANRSDEKAVKLAASLRAEHSDVKIVGWNERSVAVQGADIIINATSLGMLGQSKLEIDLAAAADNAIVVDIVYNPIETDLLRQARRRNLIAVDGLGMLLHQAIPGFVHWGGYEPVIDDAVRQLALAAIAP